MSSSRGGERGSRLKGGIGGGGGGGGAAAAAAARLFPSISWARLG